MVACSDVLQGVLTRKSRSNMQHQKSRDPFPSHAIIAKVIIIYIIPRIKFIGSKKKGRGIYYIIAIYIICTFDVFA